jgi:putative membrane protein insertion efficiency factor
MVTLRSLVLLTILLFATTAIADDRKSNEEKKDLHLLYGVLMTSGDSAVQVKEPLLPDHDVSDLRIFAHFMIRVYQTFVSSQQHDVCVFSPSCSHFGMESVKRLGFFRGVFLTADRLTRCNSMVAQGGYAFDPVAGKFIDNVATYCNDTDTTFCGATHP